MKEYRNESDLTNFGTWWMDYKDRYFRYWVYKRKYTPYEEDKKFIDEIMYEDEYAKNGYIFEAIELPDGDILLGFNDPMISEEHIEYYKLSEIRLAYEPADRNELENDMLDEFDEDDDDYIEDDEAENEKNTNVYHSFPEKKNRTTRYLGTANYHI